MFLKKIAAIGGNIKNVSSLGLAASLVEELCNHQTKRHENPDSSPAPKCLGEELPGLRCEGMKNYGTEQTVPGKSFLDEADGANYFDFLLSGCKGLSVASLGEGGGAGRMDEAVGSRF
jgi:hypothetical protein